MKSLNYKISGSDIVLFEPHLNLDQTLDCGQAFRWVKTGENSYRGFYLDRPLEISGSDGEFLLKNTTERDFLEVWADYLDLYTDYGEIIKRLSEDKTLALACKFAPGLRILRQNDWEALCSFIISQNNNIPRIKGIIGRLTDLFGHFPKPDELSKKTPDELSPIRAGFRAKYLVDAALKVSSGEIDLAALKKLPYDKAKDTLMKIKGVGPKVADCALLYGMYRTEAFPRDVWIKRVMETYYPAGLPDCTKGIEGIAQQYLFYYIRNNA